MNKLNTLLSYLLNEGKMSDFSGGRSVSDKVAELFFDDGLDTINYVLAAVEDGDRSDVISSVEQAYEEFLLRYHDDEPEIQLTEMSDDLKSLAIEEIAKRLMDPALNESVEEEKGYKGPKKYKKVVGSGKNKRTVRYGAKGYSIAPGTSKGNSYCARSYGQMKDHPSAAKDPNSPLRLSRKKWRCSGKYSKK
jgi:hypothetical protein